MSGHVLCPDTADALRDGVTAAATARQRITAVDLRTVARVLDFSPEDMTVSVEAGITVAALQATLAEAGQWLPLDPPHAEITTIADVLHGDISGPHRFAYGTVREHVIGVAAVLGDGRLVRSGGRVVKNVAGYDLAKLFIGDRGALGVVVEATFKLTPRPAAEQVFALPSTSLDDIDVALEAVLAGPTEPVVLDLHNLRDGGRHGGDGADGSARPWTLVLAFAGHPDDVAWQASQLPDQWQAVDALDHDARFWTGRTFTTTPRTSVLPSRLTAHLRTLRPDVAVLARAGNGVFYSDDDAVRVARTPSALERRVKATYDPFDIFPDLS